MACLVRIRKLLLILVNLIYQNLFVYNWWISVNKIVMELQLLLAENYDSHLMQFYSPIVLFSLQYF